MYRLITGVALGLLLAGPAHAISRYQTMSMSCAQVQAALKRDGAAILRWQSKRTPGLPLYGRYVSDQRFCEFGQVIDLDTVPTADNPACTVRQCIQADVENMPPLLMPGR
ncbi:MAG: hypothetical protein KF874_13170 [Rhizobiaceae bacterium]|nr:hypothetical protein [Rhizobiaceae bacterium]